MRVEDITGTVAVLNTAKTFLEELDLSVDDGKDRDAIVSDIGKTTDMLTRNVGLLKMGID